MNNSVSINKISKEYERLYKFFDELTNNHLETILILNDLFVVAILCKKEMKRINDFSIYTLREKYVDFLSAPENLFEKYEQEITDLFKEIYSFMREYKDLNAFEKMFGLVLEKHINRKETGSYYTPDDTTKFICWNSIFISILNKVPQKLSNKICSSINISNNVEFIDKKMTFEEKIKIVSACLDQQDKKSLIAALKTIKIIDPTCGSGAFIISAYECIAFLNVKLLDNALDRTYYFKNLFGVDILEDAISLSKTRLLIKTIIDDNFSELLKNVLNSNFICGDALRGQDQFTDGDSQYFNWTDFGTFDCIVGNPPYVEIKDKKPYRHFESAACGNLYAYAIERACNIAHNDSIVSFIVPLPLIATPRMNMIKDYLENKSDIVYYCTFADRPGCLFTGVHQRLAIFFARIGNDSCRRFTSSYKFWYKDERDVLFKSLDFIENRNVTMPKIGTNIENSIFVKTRVCNASVSTLSSKNGKYELYVSSRIGFWAKAFLDKPATNEIMALHFDNDEQRRITYCFINSSLFYYQWVILSDCWHVTNSDLRNIKFNFDILSEKQRNRLIELSDELSKDLEKNKVRINTKQTEFEYKHKYSKKIIDKIDDIICSISGLDQLETKFIKNYTLKYRLNKIEEGDM